MTELRDLPYSDSDSEGEGVAAEEAANSTPDTESSPVVGMTHITHRHPVRYNSQWFIQRTTFSLII